MISSFPTKNAYNPGGYSHFNFVPKDFVSAYPMISGGTALVPVGLAAGYAWLTGYATRGTLNYIEQPQNDGNGTYYLQTITGFVPGERAELIDLLQQMADVRYLVSIKDVFSQWRLVGSLACPLDFMAEYDSGTLYADQKGFKFTFTGTSINRSPVYNP
jgi:hypothetical protein